VTARLPAGVCVDYEAGSSIEGGAEPRGSTGVRSRAWMTGDGTINSQVTVRWISDDECRL
jgi:hypothetical protein